MGASPILCDDGEPCTTDTCDPAAGCVYVSIPYCLAAKAIGKLMDLVSCRQNDLFICQVAVHWPG